MSDPVTRSCVYIAAVASLVSIVLNVAIILVKVWR
jgi:hypothetical protein